MIYFKIGKIPIRKKGILAPMLEFSTLPYRELVRKHNCDLCYTEMVHTNYLANLSSEKLEFEDLLQSTKDDSPTSLQLVGDFTDRKTTLKAASLIDEHKYFDIIDLNLGCPSIRIIKGKSGSALLKDITKITPTIKELCETITKPITIKTRLGFSRNEIPFISTELFKTGINALAIHARCAIDSYNIPCNVQEVRNIKETSPIPIIYNGDINENNYKNYLGFDGLMVARSALGSPCIFDLINCSKQEITKEDKLVAMHEFLTFCTKHPIPFNKLKVSIIPFTKGLIKGSIIRDKISKAKTIDEIKEILPKE